MEHKGCSLRTVGVIIFMVFSWCRSIPFIYTFVTFCFLLGANIAKLTDISFDDTGQVSLPGDKNSMVRAARGLLSAVTRVLLIGDQVTINQIMASRSRVCVIEQFLFLSSFVVTAFPPNLSISQIYVWDSTLLVVLICGSIDFIP